MENLLVIPLDHVCIFGTHVLVHALGDTVAVIHSLCVATYSNKMRPNAVSARSAIFSFLSSSPNNVRIVTFRLFCVRFLDLSSSTYIELIWKCLFLMDWVVGSHRVSRVGI